MVLSAQGINSGIIMGASVWLAIATNHFGKWLAICTVNGQWPAVIFSSVVELEVAYPAPNDALRY